MGPSQVDGGIGPLGLVGLATDISLSPTKRVGVLDNFNATSHDRGTNMVSTFLKYEILIRHSLNETYKFFLLKLDRSVWLLVMISINLSNLRTVSIKYVFTKLYGIFYMTVTKVNYVVHKFPTAYRSSM